MQTKLRIKLRERGDPAVIQQEEWSLASAGIAVQELHRQGIVRLKPSGSYVLVEPGTLVGRFDSHSLQIDVAAKSEEMERKLRNSFTLWRKTVNQVDKDKSGKKPEQLGLFASFELLLLRLLGEGLPWTYKSRNEVTSRPKGRILFGQTITQLLSKGINHRVVSSVQTREFVDDFAAALESARRRLTLLEKPDFRIAARVSSLIEIVGDRSVPMAEACADQVMTKLESFSGRPALANIVAFCRQLFGSLEPYRLSTTIGTGVAEFIDMEKLWEHAVQLIFQHQVPGDTIEVRLHPLRKSPRSLFHDGGPTLDPDIVITNGTNAIAVVDAKYSLAKSPSAADVYQLTCYVTRLGAPIGILVYVAEGAETVVSKIGTLDNGACLFACYVSLAAFESGNGPIATVFSEIFASSNMTENGASYSLG
jgi:hypothetical protein